MAGEGVVAQPPNDILGLSLETPPVPGVEKPCRALGQESQAASARTGPSRACGPVCVSRQL